MLENGDTGTGEQGNGIASAVIRAIKHFPDISEIDDPLGTHRAGEMGDEQYLLLPPRSVAVDNRVFLRVKTSAIALFFSIATVGQPGCVAVVADGENFAIVRGGDDGSHSKTTAGGPLGDGVGKIEIHLFEGGANGDAVLSAHMFVQTSRSGWLAPSGYRVKNH